MSTFNLKSTVLLNRDASPKVASDPIVSAARLQESFGCDKLPQTAGAGSWVKCVSIPSSARISELDIINAGIGTSSLDIAAWYPTTTPNQSSVVAAQIISSSAFAQAIAGVDGGTVTDGMGTIAQNPVASRQQPLWQRLGLLADPNINIDLGFTVRTTNSIAGYVGLRARYVR